MRAILIAIALVVVCASATPDYASMFQNFKKQNGRTYASADEEARRFRVFVSNMQRAAQLMKVNPGAVFGANEFADMSAAEFKSRHNAEKLYAQKMSMRKPVAAMFSEADIKAAGSAIDWRTKGAVTGVKNQGQCGSCWSFSTTGGIEGQWFLAGNTLTSLSEQEFVSCDTIDSGCQGGLMDQAMTWVLQAHNGSIVTEASYPYVSGDGVVPACSMTGTQFGAQISGHKDLPHDETQMATWVYSGGPLSIAVDATSWQTYMGGIMTNCISSQIDHGVLIVGFDDTNSPPYWIIKNSWGASWGESGYIRVAKGSNQCLITSDPCTSIVSGGPGPAPPTPPSPPTPAGSDFEQKHCKDPKCKDCTTIRLAQNKCIVSGSASYKAMCITDGLLVETFASADCKGSSTFTTNPLDVCSIVFSTAQEAFILNSCKGSGPVPPTPPTPPAPTPAPSTPAPSTGTFTQMQCSDAACSQNCQNNTFPQNTCLGLNGGGSAIAVCSASTLTLTEYPLSANCTGPSIPDPMPLNQCLQDESGTYIENLCSSGVSNSKRTLRVSKNNAKKLREAGRQ